MNNYTVMILFNAEEQYKRPFGKRNIGTYYVKGLKQARELCGIPLHYSYNAGGFVGYANNRECYVYKSR